MPIELPVIVTLNDHGGHYASYEKVLYETYLGIFYNPPLTFQGKRVLPIRDPQENGKDWTFLHMTSTGKSEATRELDLRRCERVCWVRKILESAPSAEIQIEKRDKGKIVIKHQNFRIVLIENKKAFRLITTYIGGN